jgi:transposase
MVLAFSRKLYLEFTLAETLEHFLSCHQHAFEYFDGVVRQVWVDNCKVAVLSRAAGSLVLNPRYLDFANHYGFQIRVCGVGQPQEKGRVENGVGYVKKNFLNGLELSHFQAINPAARYWLDTVANVRVHGQTRKRPRNSSARKSSSPCIRCLTRRPSRTPSGSTVSSASRSMATVTRSLVSMRRANSP